LLAHATTRGLKKCQCRAVACTYIENNLSKTNNSLIELKHQRRRTSIPGKKPHSCGFLFKKIECLAVALVVKTNLTFIGEGGPKIKQQKNIIK
jgi:hypothetical protein